MSVVLISGGSGFIGGNLTRHLAARKHTVIILTRNREKRSKEPGISYAWWDVKNGKIDYSAVAKADHIIHLAGAGVMDKRWTKAYKETIVKSRTDTSQLLIKALKETSHNVKSFTSASAIGYYGEDPKLANAAGFTESDPPDDSFLGQTCVLWEESVAPVEELGIKLCKLRTGIVLGKGGGAYPEFKRPVHFGIAGILGTGKQMVSWIHIDDLCRMYIAAMEEPHLNGVYNAVSNNPVSNKQLTLTIAEAIRHKFFISVHVPDFALKLLLGEKSIEVLKSATVSAEKILSAGFHFLYPTIDAAIRQLTSKNQ